MKDKQMFALGMAVLWSAVLSTSMHNWTIGICMGICIGIAFGMFGKSEEEKKENRDEKE
ncbi:MAG: hypothetical protein IKD94_03765 [Erysipelotrichaceae bacterium]|nr:hypothetical protein [Erysipelotrichaceae bacterium]